MNQRFPTALGCVPLALVAMACGTPPESSANETFRVDENPARVFDPYGPGGIPRPPSPGIS